MVCLFSIAAAQKNIDVSHYTYFITLNDKNDTISGFARIEFEAFQPLDTISLDLAAPNSSGKGMIVSRVMETYPDFRDSLKFIQSNDKLIIAVQLKTAYRNTLIIEYKGIPSDGLIISKNKYGKRTFFSDNWPDRAHNWIPCIDDPADKASVHFRVEAPVNYKVVSNGTLFREKINEVKNTKTTLWKEDIPLPTKVMVIGVADFAVDSVGEVNGIPVSSWVFKENQKEGFYDYAQAKEVLSFFINYIGPFPYKKLANVQSKTIYGGMENASAIFYYENSVTGERQEESLFAHEIVHQWFGDMATEKSFVHIWLSEGFATYLTRIYVESKYGTDKMIEEMKNDRLNVIAFSKESKRPIVDSVTPYKQLLNPNSYQKGGWILHMLRRQLGDSVFHKIIRSYYTAYSGKNADTKDFQKICEKESGKKLETFFQQWLYTAGQPNVEVKWTYDAKNKMILLKIKQLQNTLFQFPLDILVESGSGKKLLQTLAITKQNQQFIISVKEKPRHLYLDPKSSLLFEGFISKTN